MRRLTSIPPLPESISRQPQSVQLIKQIPPNDRQTLRNFHPTSDVSFLGINDIFVPLNQIGGATEVLMVLAYSLSMLGSTLLFSFVQDRQQKILFASMSVIFIPFILRVPAGFATNS